MGRDPVFVGRDPIFFGVFLGRDPFKWNRKLDEIAGSSGKIANIWIFAICP